MSKHVPGNLSSLGFLLVDLNKHNPVKLLKLKWELHEHNF